MAKEIKWRGMTEEEVKKLDLKSFLNLLPSRARRTLLRGNISQQKMVTKKALHDDKNLRTQGRNVIITPEMIGKTIKIYNGKEYISVIIALEMLGSYLGEYAHSRKLVTHGSAGLGATRSSKGISAK